MSDIFTSHILCWVVPKTSRFGEGWSHCVRVVGTDAPVFGITWWRPLGASTRWFQGPLEGSASLVQGPLAGSARLVQGSLEDSVVWIKWHSPGLTFVYLIVLDKRNIFSVLETGCAVGPEDHPGTPGPAYYKTEPVMLGQAATKPPRIVRYIPTFTRAEYLRLIWTDELCVFR